MAQAPPRGSADPQVGWRSENPTAAADPEPKTIMIDATYLKAHRTATSLRSKKGDLATKGAV